MNPWALTIGAIVLGKVADRVLDPFLNSITNPGSDAERIRLMREMIVEQMERRKSGLTTRRGSPAEFADTAAAYGGNECVEWPYAVNGKNCASIAEYKGNGRLVHRNVRGAAPDGMVNHMTCGNKLCITPAHIEHRPPGGTGHPNPYLGKEQKWLQGESNGLAKLTEEQVLFIRSKEGARHGLKELADEYGVHPATIYSAKRGRSWKHLLRK